MNEKPEMWHIHERLTALEKRMSQLFFTIIIGMVGVIASMGGIIGAIIND